jgi:peptidoglycan/LPS O-acetylase OafA/YrhL
MPDPVVQSADPAALIAEFRRRRRTATAAGISTLVIVVLLALQFGSATVKSYSFFVGVVPALLVYFAILSGAAKRPSR